MFVDENGREWTRMGICYGIKIVELMGYWDGQRTTINHLINHDLTLNSQEQGKQEECMSDEIYLT